jgi:hypothetical protein
VRELCRCGNSPGDPWVVERPRYRAWRWIWLWVGISAVPDSVVIICDRCNHVFEESRDPERRRQAL